MKKMKKGFTLVEIITAIMLMTMISTILGIIFNTMFMGQDLIDREIGIQSEMRSSMQSVDKIVSNATAVFILDSSKYDGTKSKLTNGWSYIGVSSDGRKLLNYKWDNRTHDWKVVKLGGHPFRNLLLQLNFSMEGDYRDNRVVKYDLTGQYSDSNNKLKIDTAIMALNSKQVFSKVGKGQKGIAIAYRLDVIEGELNTAISFVLDTSGSMDGNLDGLIPVYGEKTRMQIMKEKVDIMLTSLSQIGNVYVNVVQFSSLANYVEEEFVDLEKDFSDLRTKIHRLRARGGTNVGDGLRYGMLSLKKNSSHLKYVILLSDGVPNLFSIADYSPHSWAYDLSDDVRRPPEDRHVHFQSWDGEYSGPAVEYAARVSEKFGEGIRRVNVIGFSGVDSEKSVGQNLTNRIRNRYVDSHYYDTSNEQELEEVFAEIKRKIDQDIWFVKGP